MEEENIDAVEEIFSILFKNILNKLVTFTESSEDLQDCALIVNDCITLKDITGKLNNAPTLTKIPTSIKEMEMKCKKNADFISNKQEQIEQLHASLVNYKKCLSEKEKQIKKLEKIIKKVNKEKEKMTEYRLKLEVCSQATGTQFDYLTSNVSGYIKGHKTGNVKTFDVNKQLGQEVITNTIYNILGEVVEEDMKK